MQRTRNPIIEGTKALVARVISTLAISALALVAHPAPMLAVEGEAGPVVLEEMSPARAEALDKAFRELLDQHQINTLGVGVIKNGALVWQGEYGQQSPGVPASATTLFDVGSITKTITAETILRLAEDGELSLDESMAPYWVDPDLAGDPRHDRLTPRMALTHTSGLPNWRFFTDDRKLRFLNEPGTKFGYSGEGFEYLAKYAESKLGRPFEELVEAYVFEPAGMRDVSMSVRAKNFPRIARPLDQDGTFPGYYCRPEGWCREEGDFAAAGSMVVTVADYAKFLIWSMHGEGLSAELLEDRNTIQGFEDDIDCSGTPGARCPERLGYGLGWNVTQLPNDRTIGHRGTDWSVVSLAYYYEGSGDGLIVLFNAPNRAGLAGMVDALELLDPRSAELHGYKARRDREGG
jgi:CubicO group peptidase (beta-lactamase class C family)